jgi:hypothetical protein
VSEDIQSNKDISNIFGCLRRSIVEQEETLVSITMDITNFFWDFIDYEIKGLEDDDTSFDTFSKNIFKLIPKGDLILNSTILNTKEEMDYLHYDSFDRIISYALRICEGIQLKKIEKYIEFKEYDEYMMDAFTLNIS